MKLTLLTSVQYVPRVGPIMAKRLKKLDINTVEDLLYHLPFRYNDFSLQTPIGQTQAGETVTVRGKVETFRNVFTKQGKKLQQAIVSDNSGLINVVWFNQPFLTKIIHAGDSLSLAGTVKWFGDSLVLESPEYELISSRSQDESLIHTGRLTPVYPETEGITSKWIRARIHSILPESLPQIRETLPAQILEDRKLYHLQEALKIIHFPENLSQIESARKRLGFNELMFMHLRSYLLRKHWQARQAVKTIKTDSADLNHFIKTLPFTLTGDQQKATQEIMEDLKLSVPMNRMLVGDVGSGKTVVAAIAMYAVCKAGGKSVLMAPTQILAQQHYNTIKRFLEPAGLAVKLITSETRKKASSKKISPSQEKPAIYIGTHALLTESLTLENIALTVIDEQQRFGVKQRSQLRTKGAIQNIPHLLTMTATPIPRTVALALYGNLDVSILEEMPYGRKKIKTWVVPSEKRENAYAWIRKNLRENKTQAFIVCPFIEESETLTTVKAATREYERLKTTVFGDFKIKLLHGRLKPKEKTEILDDFHYRKIDILVTTPVVEVGIDIPYATIMLIEASDRFGLAQLHQLRGRVGRSDLDSYCLLFTENLNSHYRLKALETIFSGPKLAELDLKIRGPGEVFGTRQHGLPGLKIASLTDSKLLKEVHETVENLINCDPQLNSIPLLKEKIERSTISDISQD